MKYNAIKTALPKQWLVNLAQNKSLVTDVTPPNIGNDPKEAMIKINNITKSITKTTNKDIYKLLVSKKIKSPTAIERWIESYPFLETQEWDLIYKLPYKITTEPYLQSFQYKILNRLLNCRDKLHTWNLVENSYCQQCKNIDTIEHHLFHCKDTQVFWKKIQDWLYNSIEISFKFTICEIIFGLPNNSDDLKIINYVILIAKWYINQCKSADRSIFFINFLTILKEKLEIIMYNNAIKYTVNSDWQSRLSLIL